MAAYYIALFVTLTVLMGDNWRTASACSCMPMHPQQHYCNSDMVVRGKIMRKEMMYESGPQEMTEESDMMWTPENRPLYLRYTVKMKKMYKMPGFMNETYQMYAVTSPSSASCGVMGLEKYGIYVMAGNLDSERNLLINLCGMQKDFNSLTKQQRQGFSHLYGRDSCSCEVKTPMGNQNLDSDDVNSCQYSLPMYSMSGGSCEQMYSMCLRNKHGECKWKNKRMTKSCLVKMGSS